MWTDPMAVAALVVGLVTFLFGSDLALRIPKAMRARRRARMARQQALLDYLHTAAIFLDGLPLFIHETWAWGPSVPNYGAGGRFPDQSSQGAIMMPLVAAAVEEALQLYVTHSQRQGLSAATPEEALAYLAEIQERFWHRTEAFVTAEWPLRGRSKMRELDRLRLPQFERENILNLRNQRQPS